MKRLIAIFVLVLLAWPAAAQFRGANNTNFRTNAAVDWSSNFFIVDVPGVASRNLPGSVLSQAVATVSAQVSTNVVNGLNTNSAYALTLSQNATNEARRLAGLNTNHTDLISQNATNEARYRAGLGSNHTALVGLNLTNLNTATSNALYAAIPTNSAALTNSRLFNVLDYGASGTGDVSRDAPAFKAAYSNCFYFGGVVYVPRGLYVDTNRYTVPGTATVGTHPSQGGAEIFFTGDGRDNTLIYVGITNAVYMSCSGQMPGFESISFKNVGSGTNVFFQATNNPGIASFANNIKVEGFYKGMDIGAHHGFHMEGGQFTACYIGLRILGYSDCVSVEGRSDWCRAGLVVGGLQSNGAYSKANGGRYHWGGNGDGYHIVLGRSTGNRFSGYTESTSNAVVCIGYPPDLLPEETYVHQQTVSDAILSGLVEGVNIHSTTNDFVRLYVPIDHLVLENCYGGTLVRMMTNTADSSGIVAFGTTQNGESIRFFTGDSLSWSAGKIHTLNVSSEHFSYTNKLFWHDTTGLHVPDSRKYIHGYDGNPANALAAMNLLKTNASGWNLFMGSAEFGDVDLKRMRVGMTAWDGTAVPLTVLYGLVTSSANQRLQIGGGTGEGKPFSSIDIFTGDPSVTHAGTNVASFDNTGLQLHENANAITVNGSNGIAFKRAGGETFFSAATNGNITAASFTGSGAGLTGLTPQSLAPTNGVPDGALLNYRGGSNMLTANLNWNGTVLSITNPTDGNILQIGGGRLSGTSNLVSKINMDYRTGGQTNEGVMQASAFFPAGSAAFWSANGLAGSANYIGWASRAAMFSKGSDQWYLRDQSNRQLLESTNGNLFITGFCAATNGYVGPTNPAPTSVTVGTTAPDAWFVYTGTNGVSYKVPAWINH